MNENFLICKKMRTSGRCDQNKIKQFYASFRVNRMAYILSLKDGPKMFGFVCL